MSHHIGLQVLRAKLRGFHGAGATITHRISKSQRERKSQLWNTKRSLGTVCRHHLIAYGLLRGVCYERIEKCAENNRPNPQLILEIMLVHADWSQKRDLNLEKVRELLITPVSTSPVEPVPVVSQQPQPAPTTPRSASGPSTPPTSPTKPTLLGTVSRLLEKVL